MNPFSYLTIAIFAALILLFIFLIVLFYRCYANRNNTQTAFWAKHFQQNSDEESQNNKQQSLIKQQHLNPDIIICDELNCDDAKVSDRKLIEGKLLSHPKEDHVLVMLHTFGKHNPQEVVKKSDDKKLGMIFSIPIIDNFNQSLNVDPEVIYVEDKIDKSCCI
jgi:hypothetical protein